MLHICLKKNYVFSLSNFSLTLFLPIYDISLPNHLIKPVLHGGVLAPPLFRSFVCDTVNCYFMALEIKNMC